MAFAWKQKLIFLLLFLIVCLFVFVLFLVLPDSDCAWLLHTLIRSQINISCYWLWLMLNRDNPGVSKPGKPILQALSLTLCKQSSKVKRIIGYVEFHPVIPVIPLLLNVMASQGKCLVEKLKLKLVFSVQVLSRLWLTCMWLTKPYSQIINVKRFF